MKRIRLVIKPQIKNKLSIKSYVANDVIEQQFAFGVSGKALLVSFFT